MFEDKEVIIYTKNRCSYCDRAKSLLDGYGVNFFEVDKEYYPFERVEGLTWPQIYIDDTLIGGYTELVAYTEGK